MKYAVKFPWRSTAILLLLMLLTACGQRGPLYLPEQSDGNNVQATAATSEDEEKDESDESSRRD